VAILSSQGGPSFRAFAKGWVVVAFAVSVAFAVAFAFLLLLLLRLLLLLLLLLLFSCHPSPQAEDLPLPLPVLTHYSLLVTERQSPWPSPIPSQQIRPYLPF
jgi:hypothetical protein